MEPLYRFKIVHEGDAADFRSVRVTLFRAGTEVSGWYLSPTTEAPIADGYLPRSAELIACSAVLRAVAIAERLGIEVCIIDPEDLWAEVWETR